MGRIIAKKGLFKRIFTDAGLFLAALLVGIWPGYLIGNGGMGFLLILFEEPPVFRRTLYFSVFLIVVCCVLFLASYRREYKREDFRPGYTSFSALLAFAGQILVALPLRFAMYTVGPGLYLSELFYNGTTDNPIHYRDIPWSTYLLSMLLIDLIYLAALLAGGYHGEKKRKKERRSTLTGKE